MPLTVSVPGATLDTYAKWRSFHFPADPVSTSGQGRPLGDADSDTALNLWECIRGSGPNAAGDSNPAVEEVIVKSGPDDFLGLKVWVRNVAADFEMVGEASDTMAFTPALTSPALELPAPIRPWPFAHLPAMACRRVIFGGTSHGVAIEKGRFG